MKNAGKIIADNMIQATLERVVEILRTIAPIYKGQDGEFAVNNAAESMKNALSKTVTSDGESNV